ncbi:NlpC/P60 family protein [Macrococcus epidermidis]|uniref:C40 family peptidase n=1 Tax=Macrococcus epidermidis TaxID=1902580 RepID=UPI0020B6E661|nr:NlpC/P60 family protein [Macrococcus epidermidis]UTH17357.1 C40 family peptidase [Macrococcus epidermidis]
MKRFQNINKKMIISALLLSSMATTQVMPVNHAEAAVKTYKKYTFDRGTIVYSKPSIYSYQVANLLPATKVRGSNVGSYLKLTYPAQYKGMYIHRSKLTSTAPNSNSGYTLYPGYNGIKVYYLQRKLGIPYSPYTSTMNERTVNAVKAYQKRNGLKSTGIVSKSLWTKMFGNSVAFNIDAWKKPSVVATNANHETRINAMINYANKQVGKPYIWGSTGEAGFDCSGLLLQAMRAGGFDPKGISNFSNVRPQSDLANELWKNRAFSYVSINNIQRGDLIFYIRGNGTAGHVSLYLGNNQILHSLDNKVKIVSGYKNQYGYYKLGVKRPFK